MLRGTRSLRPLALFLAASLAGACADTVDDAAADSVLARDLALAQSVNPAPVFQDTALTTPERPRPEAEPAPAPAPKPRARVERPSPAPVRERPASTVPAPAATPAPVPEREPTPAPTPTPVARGIAAGTGMRFTTGARVCTSANRPGDKLVATLQQDVRGEDGTVVPAGTKAVLEVASMTAGERPEDTRITFRVRSLVVDGESRSVNADVAVLDSLERVRVEKKGSDAKKVIGGAIAGAVLGQVLGKDTKSTVIGAAAGAAAGTAAAMATTVYDGCLPEGAAVRVVPTESIIL